MSYENINQSYYETFQQGTPFHAGAPGWTKAPWPTWGENPNMAGRAELAVNGLGALGRRRRRYVPGLQFGDDAAPMAALTTPMKILLGVGLFGAVLAYSMRGGPQGYRANPSPHKRNPVKTIHYVYAGQVERHRKGKGYVWLNGYSENGVTYPWFTKKEAQAEAKMRSAKAVFS